VIRAFVTRAFKTSMEVGVVVDAENPLVRRVRHHRASLALARSLTQRACACTLSRQES